VIAYEFADVPGGRSPQGDDDRPSLNGYGVYFAYGYDDKNKVIYSSVVAISHRAISQERYVKLMPPSTA